MTFQALAFDERIDAAPGDLVTGRLQIDNRADVVEEFTVRVVGLDAGPSSAPLPTLRVSVGPRESAICELPIRVPASIGSGEHSAAFEVSSSEAGTRAQLSSFTLSISSLAGLTVTASPSPVRGRRSAKFHVDVINHDSDAVAFTLVGESQDVRLKFARPEFQLASGERGTTPVKLRAPQKWSGESVQHNLIVTAQGRASTSSITVPYVQRPVFAHASRALMAAALVIALWVVAIAGVFAFVQNRQDASDRAAAASTTGVDTDGDGIADVFYDENGLVVAAPETIDLDGDGVPDGHVDADGDLIPVVTAVDTDGDGIADVFVESDGTVVDDPSTGADGSGDADQIASSAPFPDGAGDGDAVPVAARTGPTSTTFSGTITADGDVDITETRIVLRPISLAGSAAPGAQAEPEVLAFSGGSTSKIWSARRSTVNPRISEVRQTEPVIPLEATANGEGIWKVTEVPLRQSYEVTFALPGFDTQSFVLTPPDDGEPVELNVTLEPAIGAIRGRVLGPSGPLGGVDIQVSDGLLGFNTTADTDGDVGAYILEQLSTPGVYTLRATLRGFGTQVIQVELGQGEQLNGVDIVMQAGVGTVTGRVVDEAGRPLPGASVTASDGTSVRSTSTLTEGDIGFYAIPQLSLDTPQTIDVELAGYSSATRRLPNGSASGVDFVLVRTTSRISGQVFSSDGGGIVAAGVSISSGDLEFRTSTTNDPTGFFAVDDLPPGNYTVTVEHFEHVTETEFVVVNAGVDPPPLTVTLQKLDVVATVGTGELVVEAVDPNAETAEERPVPVIVGLTETRTGAIIETPNEASSTVRIQNIPPGTYTLTASAEGYADAAPRQVTIGLQTERREIEMERLGAAGGRMVDSLTGNPVGPFVLDLFFVIGAQEVNTGIAVIGGADGNWVTESRALAPGEYRIRVADGGAPNGYRVLEDQQLDPDATALMRFVVDPLELDTNMVLDIEADPFPDLSGRVFAPSLAAGVTTLDPIDSTSLQAVLRCDGNPNQLVATMTDLDGAQDAAAPLLDSFSIAKEDVDDLQLIGDCRIDLTADLFEATSVPVPSLAASNGVIDNDRVINAAMYSPVDTIGGSVFWIDDRVPGVPVPLDGVDFATTAIVEFPATDAPPPAPGDEPDLRTDGLSTASANGGLWALMGQVFGLAEYNVSAAGFDATSFDVAIDEGRVRTVTASPGITLTPTSPSSTPVGADTQYQIELNAPQNGSLSGQVGILTSDVGNEEFGDVQVELFQPENRDPQPLLSGTLVDPNGAFGVADIAAGTWDVEFGLPDNHIFFQGAPTVVSQRIEPGRPTPGFDTVLVDLATVDITATGLTSGTQIAIPIDAELDAPVGSGADQSVTQQASPIAFDDVVVNATDPVGSAVRYVLNLNIPGFDPNTAQVTVDGITYNRITNIPVDVVAGRDVDVAVRIDPFGDIVGSVFGSLDRTVGGPSVALYDDRTMIIPDGDADTQLGITVTKVDRFGVPTGESSADVSVEALADLPLAAPATFQQGRFRISGPSGFYRIETTHPAYDVPPIAIPTNGVISDPFLPPSAGVFEMQGNQTNTLVGSFLLPQRFASVQIDAFEPAFGPTRPTPVPVTTFTATLFQSGTNTIVASGSFTTAPTTLTNVTPGPYRLELRNGNDSYPFIAEIVVRQSAGGGTTTTIVSAPFPAAGATIEGEVRAQNRLGDPVPLPQTSITRNYDVAGSGAATGAVSDDQGGATDTITNTQVGTETLTLAASPTGTTIYSFQTAVAVGVHSIQVAPIDRYSDPAAQSVSVTDVVNVTDGPDFVFEAPDVEATVVLQAATGGAFSNQLDVRLYRPGTVPAPTEPPSGGTVGVATLTNGGATATVTFSDIPPDLRDYTLRMSDDLYPSQDFSVVVPVDDDGDLAVATVPATVQAVGAQGRLTGVLSQDDGSGPEGLEAGFTVTLVPDAGGAAINVDYTAGDGDYSLVAAAGEYELTVAPRTGFGAPSIGVTLTDGVVTTQNLTVQEFAKVEVTTTPSPLPDGTVVQLEGTDGSGPFDPEPGTLDFYVTPGQYRVFVSGVYPDTRFPSNTASFGVGAGATVIQPITLDRLVTVDVTNAPDGLGVRIRTNTSNAGSSGFEAGTDVGGGVRRYSFTPGNGVQTITYRFGNENYPGGATSANDLVETIESTFTTVTGALTTESAVAVPAGTDVTATAGTTVLTGAVVGTSNTYEIVGLMPNFVTGAAQTWTLDVTADGHGVGTAQTTVTTASTGAANVPITLVPRTFEVNFDVNGLGNNPVTGATVTLDGTSQTGSDVTFTGVKETAGMLTWSVDAGNSLTTDGGTLDADRTADLDIDVDLEQQDLIIRLTGAVATNQVQVCDGTPSATELCTSVRRDPENADGSSPQDFTFNDLDAGNYFVQVFTPGTPLIPEDPGPPIVPEVPAVDPLITNVAFTVAADGSVATVTGSGGTTTATVTVFPV